MTRLPPDPTWCDRRGTQHGAALAGSSTWGSTGLKGMAGTRHFADYSTNRIKMLGMHLDACAARQLNRYTGRGPFRSHARRSRNHRRRYRNHCNLPEDATPRRHAPTQGRLPELLTPMVERGYRNPLPSTEPCHRQPCHRAGSNRSSHTASFSGSDGRDMQNLLAARHHGINTHARIPAASRMVLLGADLG